MIQSVRDENFTGSSKKQKNNNSYQVNLVNGTNVNCKLQILWTLKIKIITIPYGYEYPGIYQKMSVDYQTKKSWEH